MATADTVELSMSHTANGVARVMQGRVHVAASGDLLDLSIKTAFGSRLSMQLTSNQIDLASLRQAVRYLERVAHDLPGDSTRDGLPVAPRTYIPATTWHESTAAAFYEARHTIIPSLVEPLRNAGLAATAFVGVHLQSVAFVQRDGDSAAAQETDSEIVTTGWSDDEKGNGWAGQASREWTTLDPAAVAAEAVRLTKLAANPVAFEPGRRTAILGRPAVAQFVSAMSGRAFDSSSAWTNGPLYDPQKRAPRLGQRVWDKRLTLRSDPNDPVASFIPFDGRGNPSIPMTWIQDGVHVNVAYGGLNAARWGVTPANNRPTAMRLSGGPTSIEEMIAQCNEGIYVNRFAYVGTIDSTTGEIRGVTDGGCFLVRHGKIDRAIKDLYFVESPWFAFNRVLAVGPAERGALGYAPWLGPWPAPPVVVPPMMIGDFNFTAMSDAV